MKVKLSDLKKALKSKIQEALRDEARKPDGSWEHEAEPGTGALLSKQRQEKEKKFGVNKSLPGNEPKELGGEKRWGAGDPFDLDTEVEALEKEGGWSRDKRGLEQGYRRGKGRSRIRTWLPHSRQERESN